MPAKISSLLTLLADRARSRLLYI